jgi:UDP-N-acetylglucosamine--N-acetylmuramyl-(pentapeptide) pyrophosphoryl-undecaprenol N-acetylglucosamine transferase
VHEAPVVVFSGGGTGGHLYPALAIADALRAERPDVRVLFAGSQRGIEGRILSQRGEWHELLPVHGFDRARPLRSLVGVVGFLVSLVRIWRVFSAIRPEVVVVTGGYAGAPAGIAAALSDVPLVLQEQNAMPGVVTRLLSRWASRIHLAFGEAVERLPAGRDRVVLSGNPVRPSVALDRVRAREALDLPPAAVVLLVVGGSQGSLALNRALLEAVRSVAEGGMERPAALHVLWATGPAHYDAVSEGLATLGERARWVHPVPYIEDMPMALAAGDLALARAGAIFTAELLVQGLPAVLVPLPTAAADHQARNAEALQRSGAAVVLPQDELTPERLWLTVSELAAAPARLSEMSASALRLARPEAARDIAASVAALLGPAKEKAA